MSTRGRRMSTRGRRMSTRGRCMSIRRRRVYNAGQWIVTFLDHLISLSLCELGSCFSCFDMCLVCVFRYQISWQYCKLIAGNGFVTIGNSIVCIGVILDRKNTPEILQNMYLCSTYDLTHLVIRSVGEGSWPVHTKWVFRMRH